MHGILKTLIKSAIQDLYTIHCSESHKIMMGRYLSTWANLSRGADTDPDASLMTKVRVTDTSVTHCTLANNHRFYNTVYTRSY